jgi:hypothetical protein
MVPKLSLDLSKGVIFIVVFIAVAVLVGLGKLDPENLKYLLVWLVPGPLSVGPDAQEPVK